ncbi:MAG TPA: HupE/UreJ family protein [Gammaproteobacteria bacterium]
MRLFLLVSGIFFSPGVWSHGIHGIEVGFAGGLLHPLSGADHLLAAVGMGLWLSLQTYTRRSVPWHCAALIAGVFLALLAKGALADIEWMLASTLIVTGLFLYKSLRMPRQLVAAVITTFFSCHFYAHINEGAATLPYICGFFISTFLLVMFSIAAGTVMGRRAPAFWTRAVGVLLTAVGVAGFGLA